MKNYFLIALLISTCTLCHAQKQVVLDLDGGITWQEIFAAGFRPKHLSGGEYMCTQYGVSVTIKNSRTGQNVDVGVGDVDFKLKANHQLVQMSFYGRENRGLEEAQAKSEKFAEMFGENVTQRAKLTTFQYKHEVDHGGRKIEPPEIEEHVDLKTTTNAAEVDDFSIIYSFSDSYSDELPLVERLSVTLKSREAKLAKRLTEKIRPPAGYEHISLEPNQEVDKPERELVVPESRREQEDARALRPIQESDVEREATTVEKPSYFPWIIGGVLLVILLLLFKTWKDRPQRSSTP